MGDEQATNDLLRLDLQRSLKRGPVDPKELSSFQRILLTTDGMVTEMLEAYLWERMTVVKLAQERVPSKVDVPELEIAKGEDVLQRTILLQGRMSHKNHLYAHSIIVPSRLDDQMRDGLLRSGKAIGLLILEDRLETFREILSCGREQAGKLSEHFFIEPDAFLIYRTYRVIVKGSPIMLITEKFPESEFQA
jgi:chorismate-pyruvate lyase